jgi:hypothetical protein
MQPIKKHESSFSYVKIGTTHRPAVEFAVDEHLRKGVDSRKMSQRSAVLVAHVFLENMGC